MRLVSHLLDFLHSSPHSHHRPSAIEPDSTDSLKLKWDSSSTIAINSYNFICALTLFIALLSLAKHSIRKHLFLPLNSLLRIFHPTSSTTKPLLRLGGLDAAFDIPGPPLTRWTNLWLVWHARLGKRYLAVHEAHEKYGPVIHISLNHISISDPTYIPHVFAQGAHALNKSPFYDAFVSSSPSLFSTRNRKEHGDKRRLFSRSFTSESVKGYVPAVHACLEELVKKFDSFCVEGEGGAAREPESQDHQDGSTRDKGQVVDILQWMNYLAFDVLSDLAFGDRLGMVESGSDKLTNANGVQEEGCISIVDHREHLASVLGLSRTLRFFATYFWLPDPFFRKGKESSRALYDIAKTCIAKRLSDEERGKNGRRDIFARVIEGRGTVGRLMGSGNEGVKEENLMEMAGIDAGFSEREIEELTSEAVTLLIAGSDTTSNSLTATLFYILTHPHIHAKLLAELHDVFGDTQAAFDADAGLLGDAQYSGNELPYLTAVINESLRLFAVTAIGLARSVGDEGMWVRGVWIKPGTEVSIPSWTIQHDPNIWGVDVETFRPERWIEDPSLAHYLMTFGFGPRACLGRNLAYLEMRMVLCRLILRYDFELLTKDLRSVEGFMHKPIEMLVRVRRKL